MSLSASIDLLFFISPTDEDLISSIVMLSPTKDIISVSTASCNAFLASRCCRFSDLEDHISVPGHIIDHQRALSPPVVLRRHGVEPVRTRCADITTKQ